MTENENAKNRLPLDRILQREETASETTAPAAQERFTDEELYVIRHDFAGRLADTFRGLKQRDIARKLLTTETTVAPYLKGDRLPTTEMLLQIHRASGVSIHWLLTGQGAKYDKQEKSLLAPEAVAEIEELAKASGRTFDAELRRLINAGKAALKAYLS